MNREKEIIEVTVDDFLENKLRVDRYIAEVLRLCSRSQIQQRNIEVTINGSPARLSKSVYPGDHIMVAFTEPEAPMFAPEPMELDIIYEDSMILVLNKPSGVVVHPAAGNHSGTLIQGILHHCREVIDAFPAETPRPGVVHRLDKDTSGVIIAAKSPEVQSFLSGQFKKRTVSKKYYALVKGRIANGRGTIKTKIARDRRHRKKFSATEAHGKNAETLYKVLKRMETYTLVALKPKTGRTHQLRVHMAHIGHPIFGDAKYGRKDRRFPAAQLMLHSYSLTICTQENEPPRTFRAPLPSHFRKLLHQLLSK